MSEENKKKSNGGMLSFGSLKSGIAWFMLFVGVACYVIGYAFLSKDNLIREIVLKIADVLVIGVVVGYVTNVADFFGVFKKDLQDIIYSDRFIKRQKNIRPIWEKVSKEMLKEKFPAIHKDLFSIILDNYICENESSYYENYKVTTYITWDSPDRKFIKVCDHITFELVSEGGKSITIPFITWLNVANANDNPDNNDYYSKFSCKIDGVEVKPKIEVNTCNGYKQTCLVKVDGKKNRYVIVQKREKRYDFDSDYDISFRARYIVKNITVILNHPEDMVANFICRGTTGDFEEVKNDETVAEYFYKGLLLQRQGYIFALRKLN